jgi:tetratricopeptide (TPR) repeat protein
VGTPFFFDSRPTAGHASFFRMKLSSASPKGLILLALAVACLIPAMPVAAETPALSRAQALAALRKSEPEERRRGALGLAMAGRMDDAPALIAALRDPDEPVRAIAEQALWAVWSRSGNARVDDLFKRGVAQMSEKRFPEAIATFTRIIELKPDFAEGWNKRATAYYLAGDYRHSLADCDEVMKRNPQHFGALSGYGQIYLQLDEPEKALEYFRRALEVNPNLEGVQAAIDRLEAFEARRRQRSI